MHYGYGFGGDCCGYGYPAQVGGWGCGTFVLIVVLFILLIIIGASWC